MEYDDFEFVACEVDDSIAWLTLNRPEKRNAMNPAMHGEVNACLRRLERDDDVRVVIVTGAGTAFSGGQDLKFIREASNDPDEKALARREAEWRWNGLNMFPKPTIAMVNGICVGGAFPIVAACDFVVASNDAKFSISEVNWGQMPGGMIVYAVIASLGPRNGLFHVLTGEPFDAEQAQQMGLANRIAPAGELRSVTADLARLLIDKDPNVLRNTKLAFKASIGRDRLSTEDICDARSALLSSEIGDVGTRDGVKRFVEGDGFRPGLGEAG